MTPIERIVTTHRSVPAPQATPQTWINMVSSLQKEALLTRDSNDVCRDPRWGRCYERYCEDLKIFQLMTEIIPGLQGKLLANSRNCVPFVAGNYSQLSSCILVKGHIVLLLYKAWCAFTTHTVMDQSISSTATSMEFLSRNNKVFTNKRVNVVLDKTNFLLWKQQVLLTVRSHCLERMLHGTMLPPLETMVGEDGITTVNEEHEEFLAQDSALASWLLSMVSPHLLSQFIGAETFAQVWNKVLQFFVNRSTTVVMSLHYKLQSLKKGGDSMRTYLTRVKDVTDALDSCGSPVQTSEHVASILRSLLREYQPFIIVISVMRNNLSLDNICMMLVNAETQFEGFDYQPDSLPVSANLAQGKKDPVAEIELDPEFNANYVERLVTFIHRDNNMSDVKGQAHVMSVGQDQWVIESGATHHVTSNESSITPHSNLNNPSKLMLDRDNSVFLEFHAKTCYVRDEASKTIFLQGEECNGLYTFTASGIRCKDNMVETQTAIPSSITSEVWHRRLGHPAYDTLVKICVYRIKDHSCNKSSSLDPRCVRNSDNNLVATSTEKMSQPLKLVTGVTRLKSSQRGNNRLPSGASSSNSMSSPRTTTANHDKQMQHSLAINVGTEIEEQNTHGSAINDGAGIEEQHVHKSTINDGAEIKEQYVRGSAINDDTKIEAIRVNTHPKMTRNKYGVFKPKIYLGTDDDYVPCSVLEALKSPNWKAVVLEENPDGTIHRYKAHLVAKGFSQILGYDFRDTFSPVVRFNTLNVILSLVVTNNWTLRQVDVNNAFLNGHSSARIDKVVRLLSDKFSLKDLGKLSCFLGIEVKRTNGHSVHACSTKVAYGCSQRILRYLVGTMNFGLVFTADENDVKVVAFADVDWGGSLNDRRSISGHSVFIGNNLVAWSSKKQKSMSCSTMEVEYKSVADTATDVVWVGALLSELVVCQKEETVIWCDNTSAVALSANLVYHAHTKHVDLDIYFMREKVAAKLMRVNYVPAAHQITYGLTKPLARNAFEEFRANWNRKKMHANRDLIIGYLKNKLKFRGLDRITSPPHANYLYSVEFGVGVEIDMVMVPFSYTEFIDDFTYQDKHIIPMSRMDDAGKRILRVKFILGMFENLIADTGLVNQLGNQKNSKSADKSLLPLPKKTTKILVAGSHAENLGYQCGCRTITWKGLSGNILTSVGGPSYAKTFSDSLNLTIPKPVPSTSSNVCRAVKCVSIVISGRLVVIQPYLSTIDALVPAWRDKVLPICCSVSIDSRGSLKGHGLRRWTNSL
ncbi:cysteine-rich receptor-like protein kinase 10-like [Hibiscus syriacus]|uniref:beta-glucosidase n=1 Tax=Hibiscus syriacus TaxID=106335 RepID=A0A6A2X329_HIBSY|nr:cysteine-rich receptor-like protein kinase 10-like [Hibiscus syriacus]